MYRFYNANTLGNQIDDCVIRAISLAEDNTWDYTYNKLSDLAQRQARMMDDRVFVRSYLDDRYIKLPKQDMTVGEVSGKYKNNILLITMNGHITCSLYGIIYDSFDCRNRIVEDVWLVH